MHWQREGCTRARHTLVSAPLMRLICYFMVAPCCHSVAECGGESELLIHSFGSVTSPSADGRRQDGSAACVADYRHFILKGCHVAPLDALQKKKKQARESVFEYGTERIETPRRFLMPVRFYWDKLQHIYVSSIQPTDDARDGVTTLGCLSMEHPPLPP